MSLKASALLKKSVCLKKGCPGGYSLEYFCPFFLLCLPEVLSSLCDVILWRMLGKISLQQLHQSNSPGLHLLQGRGGDCGKALWHSSVRAHKGRKWGLSHANWLKTEPKKHFLFVPGLFNDISTSTNTRTQLLFLEGILSSPKFETS